MDTTPFVNDYVTDTDGHTYDWRGIQSRKGYTANLLKVCFFNGVLKIFGIGSIYLEFDVQGN